MATYQTPGVYVEETSGGARPIQAVGTSTAGFIGITPNASAYLNEAVPINSWEQFTAKFITAGSAADGSPPRGGAGGRQELAHAVYGFFANGGSRCYIVNVGEKGSIEGGAGKRQGVDLLEAIDEVAIVAAPGFNDPASHQALIAHCERLRDRVAILDPGKDVREPADVELLKEIAATTIDDNEDDGQAPRQGLFPGESKSGHAAFYAPWITVRNLFQSDSNQADHLINIPPSGHIAGVFARTDSTRGVHKAPANEPIRGALNVGYAFTDAEQGPLNSRGINCIRLFSREGVTVWGARTLAPASSEWRYLNVRRLFNMIEESISVSTRWVVFEPNDMSLWKSIRRDIGAFLKNLWQQGALMGATPEEAFFVKCDADTNPPEVVNEGRVVTLIGIAPVKPAEFVIFRISQTAGGLEVE